MVQAIKTGLLLGISTFGLAVTIQFYDEATPKTLNPLYTESMADVRAQELYFDRLFFQDIISARYESKVVQSSEQTSPQSLRLTLHKNLKWHNNKTITAQDICFTVDAILNTQNPSTLAHKFRPYIKSCAVQSKWVADIEFTKVYRTPLRFLNFPLLPKSEFSSTTILPNTEFASSPVGSGPYVGAKGTQKSSFRAHRSSAHHATKIEKMSIHSAQDPLVEISTLRNGSMHGIISVSPAYLPELQTSKDVIVKTYDMRSWWFVAMNQNHPVLAKKEVRQAIRAFIDRESLRQSSIGIKKGTKDSICSFISGPFVINSPYYNTDIPNISTREEEKATTLLTNAGLESKDGRWFHDGQPITLKIGMKETLNKEAPDLLNQIGHQLHELGFDRKVYKISTEEWKQEVITGKSIETYDLVIGKWTFNLDENINPLFQTRTGDQGFYNIFNYSNPNVDRLLQLFDDSLSESQAKQAYRDVQKELNEDPPYIFLWNLSTKSAIRKELRSVIIAPYYYFTDVEDWFYK